MRAVHDDHCAVCCNTQDQHCPNRAHFWLRHLETVLERVRHLPRMHQARLPVLLFESFAQEKINAGLLQHSHNAMELQLRAWLQILKALSSKLSRAYWDGLWDAYWQPSVGTARPVFRDMDGRPR